MHALLTDLDYAELNDTNVNAFFDEIERLQSMINDIYNVSEQSKSEQIILNADANFDDISLLSMYYNNVRCITNKKNICMKIDLSPYKILCFIETWLTSQQSNSVYFPKQFNVFRCDRTNSQRRSGGVALLVHVTLISRQIKLKPCECECLAIEIKLEPKPLLVYVLYMREFNLVIANQHHKHIEELTLNFPNHQVLVLGDFNIHSIGWIHNETSTHYTPIDIASHNTSYHRNVAEFLSKMESLPLYQLSNMKNVASNVLDLVFVNELKNVKVCEDQNTIIEFSQQDKYHIPYEITIEYCKNRLIKQNERIEVFYYTKGNYDRMCQQLDNINFAHEFNQMDVDSAFEHFQRIMNELLIKNVPKKSITLNSKRPKWWTRHWQRLKNRRDKMYKRRQKGGSTDEYTEALHRFNELNDKLFKSYIDNVQNNISSNPSEFWNFAKLRNKSSSYPNEMYYLDRNAASPQETVDLFADFFETIYDDKDEKWSFNDVFNQLPTSREINVTLFDIEAAINSIKWKSSIGPDEITPFIIKKCIDAIVWPIWLLFQKTFDSGRIPDKLKLSRVVPVHKKGDKKDVQNYRVIAISSVILKIFEKAVKFKLNQIIEPQLSSAQHGFREKRSVSTNLMNLSIMAHETFARGTQIDIFYGDFKNAFDRVWHKRLIEKMARYNIGIVTAKWLCEFIIGRTSYVKIGNATSRTYVTMSGVPPGSVLGPSMFSIFIDDLEDVMEHTKLLLFADDVKLLKKISTIDDTIMLQNDINNLQKWSENNHLYLNNQKCAIFTASRRKSHIKINYKIGDHLIERKEEIRDLGILLDQRLSFSHHIEQITAHARQMIGYIKSVSNGNFSIVTQKILYLAYVRSKLEFASVIWNPYQEIYKDDIESIQKQFVIYLLENRKRAESFRITPYVDRCKTLNIQPLELRRNIADILFAYDIHVFNINDEYLKSKFVRNQSVRALRNFQCLEVQFYHTDYLKYQPISRLIKLINKYIQNIEQTNSREIFKKIILKELVLEFK